MGKILSLFTGGIYGYLIALGVGACLSGGATYYIVHNASQLEIRSIQLADANQKAADISASLTQLQGFISGMHVAETNYSHTLDAINANVSTLKGQWKMRPPSRYLSIASLMLSACQASTQPSTRPTTPIPPPPPSLAAPCETLPDLPADYDGWGAYIISVYAPAYARCSAKQKGLVEGWPK